jgi:hypothetical protein
LGKKQSQKSESNASPSVDGLNDLTMRKFGQPQLVQEESPIFKEPDEYDLARPYPGRLLFREMYLRSKLFGDLPLQSIYFYLSLVHAFLPIIVVYAYDRVCYEYPEKCKDNWKFPPGYSAWDKYKEAKFYMYHLLSLFMNCLVFYTNIAFLIFGSVDMRRRLWMMQALTAVLEPMRIKTGDSHKSLPLWNFMDAGTMQSWMNTRMMVKDIGLRFYK